MLSLAPGAMRSAGAPERRDTSPVLSLRAPSLPLRNLLLAQCFGIIIPCLRTFSRIGTETAETLLDPTQLRHQRSSSSCGAMGHHACAPHHPASCREALPFLILAVIALAAPLPKQCLANLSRLGRSSPHDSQTGPPTLSSSHG